MVGKTRKKEKKNTISSVKVTFLLTWYIGSKLTSSLIQKKIMEAWTATGLYPSRVSSISFSVSLATFCFLAISSLRTLDELRIWIAVSSSEKSHSILSQIKKLKYFTWNYPKCCLESLTKLSEFYPQFLSVAIYYWQFPSPIYFSYLQVRVFPQLPICQEVDLLNLLVWWQSSGR